MATTLTELVAATTSAATAAFACTGRATIAITGGKLGNATECVVIWGEDAAGAYTDEITRLFCGKTSALIEEYRNVQVQKTATKEAVAIDYGA